MSIIFAVFYKYHVFDRGKVKKYGSLQDEKVIYSMNVKWQQFAP